MRVADGPPMSASGRGSRLHWLRRILLVAATGLGTGAAAAPERVVSASLCTDQLAMLLAGDGQLQSVSYLSQDPRSSAMAVEAMAFRVNHGRAEEIFLMQPDLVITSSFASQAMVQMLRRLGVRVAVMDPAYSFDDIRARIREMGALLGRETRAEAMVRDFDDRLAGLRAEGAVRPLAALYAAQGYMAGPKSLSGAILDAAGFDNAAAGAGLSVGAMVPLETLVMLAPDLVVLPSTRPLTSRAQEVLHHPVLARLGQGSAIAPLTTRDWICGTPMILGAVADLAQVRQSMEDAE